MDANQSSSQFPLPGTALVPLTSGVFVFTENSFKTTRPGVSIDLADPGSVYAEAMRHGLEVDTAYFANPGI